ncbi:hypothetical protein [Kineosporia sp. A_224]|uniref:hypothetical protein n=1 Tax=Kineosporia sp. A_224 TaxID=1962180 RepID=UPI000B4B2587|nr:hypothetical protein [Kineosporia sp. A_224]
MTPTAPSTGDLRRRTAERAYAQLGHSPSPRPLLAVHCASAHHVATVFATPAGAVFVSVPRAHSHGDRDRHDAAHHGGHRDRPYVDWVDPDGGVTLDDPLPAGCECGARSLSRRLLLRAVAAGEHRMVID